VRLGWCGRENERQGGDDGAVGRMMERLGGTRMTSSEVRVACALW
jgi:hypothetical protein